MFEETVLESKNAWNENADFGDKKMGDDSNYFHCCIVRPGIEELLEVNQNDYILDVACGTGNFSQRIAEKGANVVAFDFSSKLIEHAKRRRKSYFNNIEFHECDATDYQQLMTLKKEKKYTKAVSCMAIMDIAEIKPLFQALYNMLDDNGVFVFATHHPCFARPEEKYITPCVHKGEAINGQPVMQNYYHRSMQDIFQICFDSGFVIDGFEEKSDDNKEIPVIIIVRARKR